MDPLVLDAHHQCPALCVGVDFELYRVDHLQNHKKDLLPELFNLLDCRPTGRALNVCIPFHFVHSHGEDGFQLRVYSLCYDPLLIEFVHIERRCMTIIKDKGMS